MNFAIITTATGGCFRLADAFLVGMDRIAFEGGKHVYEIQEGDKIQFVTA